ncbi:MAG: hypothetical protein CSB23_04120 [Deltaproteobacteria bacterium]|nr:MAG: hypothetical protein CSB23_04120 [Deltaproteobacteria bacterium]
MTAGSVCLAPVNDRSSSASAAEEGQFITKRRRRRDKNNRSSHPRPKYYGKNKDFSSKEFWLAVLFRKIVEYVPAWAWSGKIQIDGFVIAATEAA